VAENQANEAVEKLNRGIQESRLTAQRQAMELARDYVGDSVERLKQQVGDSRAALEDLPRQVPGGEEGSFQSLFQELMDNYATIEEALDEVQQNVSDLDTEQSEGEVELDASEAARRKAEELGVDLSQVEGSGSGGRIVVKDVTSMAEGTQEQPNDQATQEAQDAAGQVTQQVQETAGQAAEQVQDAAGQAAGQAQDAAGQATDLIGQAAQGVQDPARQVTDQVGQAAQGLQEAAGQATQQAQEIGGQVTEQAAGEDGAEEPKVTNAARRKAEELGVDLSQVQGTGADGLVTLKDVTGS
jgi:pyruvate/2-oxoglutarate dehydrogenase complex dihydrolipoamide acyltransferase (E2) component